MIITLYGSDSYIRENKKKGLIDSYKSKHKDVDIIVFDLEEDENSWVNVVDFLKQPSMFVDAKLAVIKNATEVENKKWRDVLKKYLKNENIFILVSQKKKPNRKFKFLLDPPAIVQEFKELEGKQLLIFFQKESKKRNLVFSSIAQFFFISYIKDIKDENISWMIINELNKIYLANFEKPIKKDDLEKIIHWSNSDKLFNITRNILSAEKESIGLSYLEDLLLKGESAGHIFNLLGHQARGKNALRLSKYDVSIKLGGLEYEEALVDFIIWGTPNTP